MATEGSALSTPQQFAAAMGLLCWLVPVFVVCTLLFVFCAAVVRRSVVGDEGRVLPS